MKYVCINEIKLQHLFWGHRLLENGEIVTDYSSKAEIFNTYFASQCTPFDENDVVPNIQLRTPLSLSLVII